MTQPCPSSAAPDSAAWRAPPPSEAAPLTDLVKDRSKHLSRQARASPAPTARLWSLFASATQTTISTHDLNITSGGDHTTPQGHSRLSIDCPVNQSPNQSIEYRPDRRLARRGKNTANPLTSSTTSENPASNRLRCSNPLPTYPQNTTKSCAEPPSDRRSWRPAPAGRPPPPSPAGDAPSRRRRHGRAVATATVQSSTPQRAGCLACGRVRRRRRRAGRAWRTTASAAAWLRLALPMLSSLTPRESYFLLFPSSIVPGCVGLEARDLDVCGESGSVEVGVGSRGGRYESIDARLIFACLGTYTQPVEVVYQKDNLGICLDQNHCGIGRLADICCLP